PSPVSDAARARYVSSESGTRVSVYEHHATVLSQPTEQKRGLRAQASRHDIDWKRSPPATAAISAGVGVSRPRIGRYTMRSLPMPPARTCSAARRAAARFERATRKLTPL